ncbi:glyoxalase/bleomycin resistance/dioxygenase family protein [Streptomyces sp. NPDC056512]|uniref:glyoxalase/bleomycin resistance/dioxygenase family protein n=1 Tax=Streptomyces sp. NPDC056512 TaxID=3345846 RepID=UPI0036A5D296
MVVPAAYVMASLRRSIDHDDVTPHAEVPADALAGAEPPLKLVLIEGEPDQETRLDHLGVEVETTEQVTATTGRLKDAGLATFEENDTSCCYAVQDKVWVHGPGPGQNFPPSGGGASQPAATTGPAVT